MKKNKNNNLIYENQKSFFFEDFFETSQKQRTISKSKISDDRVYILFSVFFSLILIFSISIFSISVQPSNYNEYKANQNSLNLRRDVLDRNGELIARNINTFRAGVKPGLIKNKENFIIKIKLNFPETSTSELRKKLSKKKIFLL